MAFVNFDDKYKVGHPDIDSQHAQLFDAINRLHDAMKTGKARGEMIEVMAFLREYTVFHFQTEERLMAASKYPQAPGHKGIHDDLTRQVLELEERQKAGSLTISISVMNFLKDWLANHILEEDRKLAAHLKASGH